jgi:hypothetical protein
MVPDITWLLENCVEPVLDHLTERKFKNAQIGCFLVRDNSWAEVASPNSASKRASSTSWVRLTYTLEGLWSAANWPFEL